MEHGMQYKNDFWSSCIYPKFCRQPMKETDLLTGKLEETNEAYAIAKIGIKIAKVILNNIILNIDA